MGSLVGHKLKEWHIALEFSVNQQQWTSESVRRRQDDLEKVTRLGCFMVTWYVH